jgi:hypothetical protein
MLCTLSNKGVRIVENVSVPEHFIGSEMTSGRGTVREVVVYSEHTIASNYLCRPTYCRTVEKIILI